MRTAGRRRALVVACAVLAIALIQATAWPVVRGRTQIISFLGGAHGLGGPAIAAALDAPRGVAVDENDTVYIADTGNNMVHAVSPNGVINRFAGTGVPCPASTDSCGDFSHAVNARLTEPWGVAVDTETNTVLIADTGNHRVRAVSGTIIATIAGTGVPTAPDKSNLGAEGSAAVNATLHSPTSLTALADRVVLIADRDNDLIRTVRDGAISTAAGGGLPAGIPGPSEAVPAQFANLEMPTGVSAVAGASFLIADTGEGRVREVDGTSGLISSRVGVGSDASTTLELNGPVHAVADSSGNLYISDREDSRILHVTALGVLSVLAGEGGCGFAGDNGPASEAQLCAPSGLALSPDGSSLYVADTGNDRIRTIDLKTRVITTFAGGGVGDGTPAHNAHLEAPSGLTVTASGDLYVADAGDHRIRHVGPTGVATTVAGTGIPGYSGDGFGADEANLQLPSDVAASGATLYVADTGNDAVRRVSASRLIDTVDLGGLALSGPRGVEVDSAGTLYVADTGNGRIVKRTSSGSVSTIAAGLLEPSGLALAGGSLYVAETGRHQVVAIDLSTSAVTVVAGTGTACPASTDPCGDGGAATAARLSSPRGVDVDVTGEIYIADTGNNRIRYVGGGAISTVQGTGVAGFDGDNGDPAKATLRAPEGVAVGADVTDLFISDTGNRRVRRAT